MITRSLSLAALTLTMLVTAGAVLAADTDEQAVAAAEHQWLKSQKTNNVELFAALLADKVLETSAEGKLISGKDAVVADAKSVTWSSADYTDEKVTVFEHTAIATGMFVGKGTTSAGKAIEERVRYTDTWVKMANGKWMCVASQDTEVKM